MMRSLARPAFTMFLSCIKAGFGGRIRGLADKSMDCWYERSVTRFRPGQIEGERARSRAPNNDSV